MDNRVLLPGITTLTRLVAEVRAAENAALYRTLDAAVPDDLRQSMRDLLKVPEAKRVSELERLRTPPMRVSGSAMTAGLERAKDVRGLGAHLVATSVVPAARTARPFPPSGPTGPTKTAAWWARARAAPARA
nr:hypothetical protein [Streptomyces sp. WM4235]